MQLRMIPRMLSSPIFYASKFVPLQLKPDFAKGYSTQALGIALDLFKRNKSSATQKADKSKLKTNSKKGKLKCRFDDHDLFPVPASLPHLDPALMEKLKEDPETRGKA